MHVEEVRSVGIAAPRETANARQGIRRDRRRHSGHVPVRVLLPHVNPPTPVRPDRMIRIIEGADEETGVIETSVRVLIRADDLVGLRSIMKGLGVPVMNQFGLRPAVVKGTRQIAPLTINKDLDKLGLLNGVTTFNFHPHLPHYALTKNDPKAIHVLAQQPVDMSHPHPFTEAGNRVFNMFLWMPASGERAGDILLADSTIFTTLFGGDESLERFWKNIATK